MNKHQTHRFHIPVLGLGFSIDTPVKIARYGISSVISIIEDELIERMRGFYLQKTGAEYIPIPVTEHDHRAKRITAYLNLVNRMVNRQVDELKKLPFEKGSEINTYFELLPDQSEFKRSYNRMCSLPEGEEKEILQQQLRDSIAPGSIDVNIMAKVDNLKYDKDGIPLPSEYSDALSALRGYARSELRSSIVFSAGYNPRLYQYLEKFPDFFPDGNGEVKKKIIVKVSDYRSALLQGKLLAKKGLWVSEFRIESGLNCGGHAFATDGLLLGPILEEFKQNREKLVAELWDMCKSSAAAAGTIYPEQPALLITVQGGIGTAFEQDFLLDYYGLDRTGWGSPFLLVPEATNVDEKTLEQLATAEQSDYFLSNASPLGVPFNNFRKSSSELQRLKRISKNRPGSPCYKKYLSSNTEFTSLPICTASRQYQHKKIDELKGKYGGLVPQKKLDEVHDKDCLCEGLTAPVLLKNGLNPSHNLTAVAICPGPNLAYFSGVFTLKQMVDHIYGRSNALNEVPRSNMFVNEFRMYMDHLQQQVTKIVDDATAKKVKQLQLFKENLAAAVDYYAVLSAQMIEQGEAYVKKMRAELNEISERLNSIQLPSIA